MTEHPSTGPDPASRAAVKVARAHDQVEAEFLQGLLRDRGIPSLVQRAPGFDTPEFLVGGPRDVLVAASAASDANDVLLRAGTPRADATAPAAPTTVDPPRRVLAALLIALAVVAGVICVALDVVG